MKLMIITMVTTLIFMGCSKKHDVTIRSEVAGYLYDIDVYWEGDFKSTLNDYDDKVNLRDQKEDKYELKWRVYNFRPIPVDEVWWQENINVDSDMTLEISGGNVQVIRESMRLVGP